MTFGLMVPPPYPRGIVALREIRRHQSSTSFCIKKKSFARLVREVIQDVAPGYKLKHEAIDALQESSETYLVDLLKKASSSAIHAKRVTLTVEDLQFVLRILNEH